MTKVRQFILLVGLAVVLIAASPTLLRIAGADPLSTFTYEGTLIVYPGEAPDPKIYRQAQSDRDRAVLILRWRGNRAVQVEWEAGAIRAGHRVEATPGQNGITTFSVMVGVRPGMKVGISGGPDPQHELGWIQCLILHRGETRELERPRGAVACGRVIPPWRT